MAKLRRFVNIPAFGFLYTHLALLLVIPAVMIFAVAWGFNTHPKGFEIHVKKAASVGAIHDTPLIVTVVACANCDGPNLAVNSKPVSWENLQSTLKSELSRRAERVVYIDGDKELPYADVVYVVDIVQGAWYGTSVVLMTPEIRKQLEAKAQAERSYVQKCTPKLIAKARIPRSTQIRIRKGEKDTSYAPLIAFRILASGAVADAVVKRSSGFADIDSYALAGVREFRYNNRPGCGDAESEAVVNINFTTVKAQEVSDF